MNATDYITINQFLHNFMKVSHFIQKLSGWNTEIPCTVLQSLFLSQSNPKTSLVCGLEVDKENSLKHTHNEINETELASTVIKYQKCQIILPLVINFYTQYR
jgi:hypothetical protein